MCCIQDFDTATYKVGIYTEQWSIFGDAISDDIYYSLNRSQVVWLSPSSHR